MIHLASLKLEPFPTGEDASQYGLESLSVAKKEEMLENMLLDASLTAARKFKATANLLEDPEKAAAIMAQASNTYVNLKKARNNNFTETPDISLLLRLEAAVSEPVKVIEINPPKEIEQ